MTRAGHTTSLTHKKKEVTQLMLDHLLGPPMHDPSLPVEDQLINLSLRGDEKLPIDHAREKGMHGPISRERFRRYWGSHISGFGKRVHDLCLRYMLETPKFAFNLSQKSVILIMPLPCIFKPLLCRWNTITLQTEQRTGGKKSYQP